MRAVAFARKAKWGNTGVQRFRRTVCPANYEEHDPWYEAVQCVHLHGSVFEPEKGFTFSLAE
jgi:hypothetical protein